MKKGFTLIELLAVIVILAIIALIATPIILGIIDDARIGSIEASANGYVDAVEYNSARVALNGEEVLDGTYDVSKLEIDLDGEKPSSGTVLMENGIVKEATLIINGYTIYYDGQNANVLYADSILNGADPQLEGELVPIVFKNKKVYKADISKKWYSYEDKKWANAVILFGKDNYKAGDYIDESAIKEYYVWIPKYSYRLWNVNNNTNNMEKPIEIVFGSKAKTTGENNGDMYVHPAFENFGTQGIWVGKFETSYNEETYTNSSTFLSQNPNYEVATDPANIIIKPSVRSLTNKNVSEYHTLLYNSHRDLNSHMMTNMEWGAAAYLTYSIYGRCDSDSCTEVTNNNVNTGTYGNEKIFSGQWENGTTITGCAADNIGDAVNSITDLDKINKYDTKKGMLASTTGNITGIYDMSGGTWEYVMGVLADSNGIIFSGRNSEYNSNFKGIYGCPECDDDTSGITENIEGLDMPDSRYYNIYKNNYELSSDIWYIYSEGILGDATKEVAILNDSYVEKWFDDDPYFVTPQYPWLSRGGNWAAGTGAGIFNMQRSYGNAFKRSSSRLVLAF